MSKISFSKGLCVLIAVVTWSSAAVRTTAAWAEDYSGSVFDVERQSYGQKSAGDLFSCDGVNCEDADIGPLSPLSPGQRDALGQLRIKFDQQTSASCTGVRVAWDAIMTTAHCVKATIGGVPTEAKSVSFAPFTRLGNATCAVSPVPMIWKDLGKMQMDPHWDVVFLKILQPGECKARTFDYFNVASRITDGPLIMLHYRSGMPAPKMTTCAPRQFGQPSLQGGVLKFETNCPTDHGSSGAPIYQIGGGLRLVGLHQGAKQVSTGNGQKRWISVELAMDELGKQANLNLQTLAVLKHLMSEFSQKCRNPSAPSCTAPTLGSQLVALNVGVGILNERKVSGIEDKGLKNLSQDQSGGLDPETGLSAEAPGVLPSSNLILGFEDRAGRPPSLVVKGLEARNYAGEVVDASILSPPDLRYASQLRKQEWLTEDYSRSATTSRRLVRHGVTERNVRVLPQGIWEVSYTSRIFEPIRAASRETLFKCSEVQGSYYVPAGLGKDFLLEQQSYDREVIRPSKSRRSCVPDPSIDAKPEADPVQPLDPGDGRLYEAWLSEIISSIDLPEPDARSVANGIIPPQCSDASQCALFFRLVSFRSIENSSVGQLGVNRTYKVLAVERGKDEADFIELKITSCQVHPGDREGPINWPAMHDVIGRRCPKSSTGMETAPVVTYQMYKPGIGIVCELKIIEGQTTFFSHTWLKGISDKSCLQRYLK